MDGDLWYFEKIAPIYDWIVPRADPTLLEQGIAQASRQVEVVVDLAGGTGRALQAVTASRKIIVDASRQMLRQANKHVWRVQASGTLLPLGADTIDAILIVDALHHLPDTARVIRETKRVLRPGGVVVILDFDRATIRGRLLAAGEHVIGMQSEFYTADEIETRLEAAGFISSILATGFGYAVVGRIGEGESGRP